MGAFDNIANKDKKLSSLEDKLEEEKVKAEIRRIKKEEGTSVVKDILGKGLNAVRKGRIINQEALQSLYANSNSQEMRDLTRPGGARRQ